MAAHPDLASGLRTHLDGLRLLRGAAVAFQSELPDRGQHDVKQLGDYRLLREIGRGGMGIVYEAEDCSLNRRVAVKILPFAAVLDQKQITRFRHEAQASAQLHHPNIVPVYAVGIDRGVHYYAMQFVDGQPLNEAIVELRDRCRQFDTADAAAEAGATVTMGPTTRPAEMVSTSPWQTFSTRGFHKTGDFFRKIADVGIQVANGLQQAHDFGVIHRDIKPSNLMVDGAGKVWITDFGLARVPNDASVTASGDVLGTARYMSPEQAAGHSAYVDHRTDIYSLGITLYELLTLQPAFAAQTREEFLRQVALLEPVAPRRLNGNIPTDLETIVLKAIEKEPAQRYATASELAGDLQRFLDGKPTTARRPTLLDRASKWAKRHRAAVVAAVGLITLAAICLAVSTVMIARAQSRTQHANTQLAAAQARTKQALTQAEAVLNRADLVVNRYGVKLARQLRAVPGAEQLSQELLQDTLLYHRAIISEYEFADDPSRKFRLAVAHLKSGEIAELIGQTPRAQVDYQQAKQLLTDLIAQAPSNESYQAEFAVCLNLEAMLMAKQGDLQQALLYWVKP